MPVYTVYAPVKNTTFVLRWRKWMGENKMGKIRKKCSENSNFRFKF